MTDQPLPTDWDAMDDRKITVDGDPVIESWITDLDAEQLAARFPEHTNWPVFAQQLLDAIHEDDEDFEEVDLDAIDTGYVDEDVFRGDR